MMFDRLCGIIEAHLKYFIPSMHKAHLFDLPIIPHKELPKAYQGDIKAFEKEFFLPYPVTAIEDKVSCIVFIDKYPNQTGMHDERIFIECLALNTEREAFRESVLSPKKQYDREVLFGRNYHEQGFAVVSIGTIYKMHFTTPTEFHGEGSVSQSMMASKKEIFIKNLHLKVEEGVKPPLINAYSAIQEIVYFNQPTNFILEEKPVKQREHRTDKILRSGDRPKYTILNPFEIRKRMRLPQPQGTHASPIPHERRRHDRWLSDNRFAFNENNEPIEPRIIPFGKRKGEPYYKHVIVPATWVGPSENTYGNKHYKVVLNR